MSRDWEFEFFEALPLNPAERQAAEDAAADHEWSSESRRVEQKVVRELRLGEIEI